MTWAPGGTEELGPEGLPGWLTRLGPLASRRPPPSLGRAVAAVGGALVAAGAVTVAGERWASSGSNGLAVLLSGAALAGSVAAVVRAPPPVQVAAVAASGIAAPALAFFLSAGGGLPSVRAVALLAGLLLTALYVAGPWRGHTFHLALLVAAGWLFALSLTDLGGDGTVVDGFGTLGDVVTGAGVASMAVGVLYLGAGWWFHAARLEGMATPFLAVGCLALPLGAFVVVRDGGDLAGGMVALAAGAGMALVGGRCRRRGTTWIGVVVATFGVLGVVEGVAPDDIVAAALLLAAAGAGIVVAAPLVALAVGEAGMGEPRAPAEDGPPPPPERPDPPEPPDWSVRSG